MLYNFLSSVISISHIAIFINIADIIGNGKNLNAQLNNNADIISVKIAIRNADVLWFAQEFIFNAVLTNTAVFGNHQTNHVHILDNASHNTSLSLLNLIFVIFSAILAEIIVSIIAIIATTKEIVNNDLIIKIRAENESIFIFEKNEKSTKENDKLGNFVTKSNIFGSIHLETSIQIPIHIIVKTMTAGNLGKYFLQIIKKPRPNKKVINDVIFTFHIFLNNSYIFIAISWCCSIFKEGSFNHRAPDNCHKAIVIHTEIKNQWRAVDGISVIYFVSLKI